MHSSWDENRNYRNFFRHLDSVDCFKAKKLDVTFVVLFLYQINRNISDSYLRFEICYPE